MENMIVTPREMSDLFSIATIEHLISNTISRLFDSRPIDHLWLLIQDTIHKLKLFFSSVIDFQKFIKNPNFYFVIVTLVLFLIIMYLIMQLNQKEQEKAQIKAEKSQIAAEHYKLKEKDRKRDEWEYKVEKAIQNSDSIIRITSKVLELFQKLSK